MKIYWTKHAEKKIKFYQLSKQRLKRILTKPYRIEEGVAPQTVALMQPAKIKKIGKKKTWNQEIWLMIQKENDLIKIISAWRYPGISPQSNPIPEEILLELKKEGLI
ncbi:hypothetical protein HRbin35_00245 [bacterium HR35]|nr:hypothetical protein HRbin35_00245 [bacterium HR35]